MTNRFLPALLAAAALTLSLGGCKSPDGNPTSTREDDDVAITPLPPLPPPVDTAGGKKVPEPDRNSVNRELTAPNATDDIKRMQPQM